MKVVLHVGATKTGSSALQTFLNTNRDVLARDGIWYPKAGIGGTAHHVLAAALHPNAHNLHADSLPPPEARPAWFRDTMAGIEAEARARKASCILLSSEYLWGQFRPEFYQAWAEALAFADVVVYAVVRSPEDWVPSSYIQAVKGGASYSLAEWFDEAQRIGTRGTDFATVLRGWAVMSPDVSLQTRDYSMLNGGHRLFADILEVAGLRTFDAARYAFPARPINPSPSPEALRMMLAINRSNLAPEFQSKLRTLILTFMGKKKPGALWDNVDPDALSQIETYYADVRRTLEQDFHMRL